MHNNKDKEFDAGERVYYAEKTKIVEQSMSDHVERYYFAKKYLKPDFVVLDAASGSGYGSEILANCVKKVVGLEISDHALEWARNHHQKSNIEFKKADLNKSFDLPDNHFDAVISFETLEHVANQENVLFEFKRVLKPGGLLIISSPDREIITEKSGVNNKFHINELSKKEFVTILRENFKLENIFGQTKYVALPWYKTAIKFIAKLDFFKLRRKTLKLLGLSWFVHEHFTPMTDSSIEKIDFDSPGSHYILLIVCRK